MRSTSPPEQCRGSFHLQPFLSTDSHNKWLLNLLFYSRRRRRHSCTVSPLTKPVILFNVTLTSHRGGLAVELTGRSDKLLFRGDTCFCSLAAFSFGATSHRWTLWKRKLKKLRKTWTVNQDESQRKLKKDVFKVFKSQYEIVESLHWGDFLLSNTEQWSTLVSDQSHASVLIIILLLPIISPISFLAVLNYKNSYSHNYWVFSFDSTAVFHLKHQTKDRERERHAKPLSFPDF